MISCVCWLLHLLHTFATSNHDDILCALCATFAESNHDLTMIISFAYWVLHLLHPTMIISSAYWMLYLLHLLHPTSIQPSFLVRIEGGRRGLDLDITDTSSNSQLAHKSNQFIAVCHKNVIMSHMVWGIRILHDIVKIANRICWPKHCQRHNGPRVLSP